MLKNVHLVTVVLTISFFVIRGVWMLRGSAMLQRRWVRTAPHVNDTILLLSAIALAIRLGQYPFVHDWLTAKVLALLAYIILGSVAIRRGRTRQIRIVAWLGALLVFGYIVSVAMARSPQGFLAGLI